MSSIGAHLGTLELCIVVGCASYAVRPLNPPLLSHTKLNVLIAVSVWVFCNITHAEAFGDPDSDIVTEQPARGKSALRAHDNPEAVTEWQQTAPNNDRKSRGMESDLSVSIDAD